MPLCAKEDCGRWRPATMVRVARLGLRVDGKWFCSPDCVASEAADRLRAAGARSAAARGQTPLRMASLMVHMGAITPAQLKTALASQKSSGLRIGAELRRLGFADTATVLRALAAQAGISYLGAADPACVRLAPGGLCAEEVRALGVVPIRIADEEQVIAVACAAPVPWAALTALGELTGYRPVPYLVSDEDFDALASAYGADLPATRPAVRAHWVDGVHDAARRIAEAAAGGAITVSEAHVEPLTWVRVAGSHGIDAMLVCSDGPARKEAPAWLADSTPH